MKKICLLVLLLCVSLMIGCTATDPDNQFEAPSESLEDTTLSGTENILLEPDGIESAMHSSKDDIFYCGSYQYGNMQGGIPGNYMLIGNDVVFCHVVNGQSKLYAYDLVTEEVRFYCDDATCKHSDCVAEDLYVNLEVYEGELFGLMSSEGKGERKLCPAVAKGNNAEVIVHANAKSFFHHEDKLYIATADSSLVVLEEGKTEPSIILEEYTGYWHVIFGDYLYAYTLDNSVIRVDLKEETPKAEVLIPKGGGITDGEYIYYRDGEKGYLYRCNMDGSEPQLLVEERVGLVSLNYDDEYFYYWTTTTPLMTEDGDARNIYRFPKNDPTQIEKIVTLPVAAGTVYTVPGTDKLFITTYQQTGDEEQLIYVVGTDGINLKKLELPEV